MHVGRSVAKKKALSEAIVSELRDLPLGVAAITVEVVDMDADSYSRYYTD
jgi:5-carboxymethyl-2-hydroxymuconate isomerase